MLSANFAMVSCYDLGFTCYGLAPDKRQATSQTGDDPWELRLSYWISNPQCHIKVRYLKRTSHYLHQWWPNYVSPYNVTRPQGLDTLRPRQNGRYFPEDIFECIFWIKSVWIPMKISLNFVSKSPTNNIPAFPLIMTWHRPGDRPLCEPMPVRLPTYIRVTRPKWVKLGINGCSSLGMSYGELYNKEISYLLLWCSEKSGQYHG